MQISYGVQLDGAGRTTRRDDRNGLPFAGSVVLDTNVPPTLSGQLTKDVVSWTSSLPIALPNSHEGAAGNAVYSYDVEYDLTQTTGYGGIRGNNYVDYGYTRDTAGRVTRIDRGYHYALNFNTTSSTYKYEPNSDRLKQIVNADGTHDLTYDARGLLRQISIPAEGTYVFDYDALGRNSKLTYPDGHTREQLYDNEGRITSRCYRASGLPDRCYTATYDPVGNPRTMTDHITTRPHPDWNPPTAT